MGGKKFQGRYDAEGMKLIEAQLIHHRSSLENAGLKAIDLDRDGLEEAIRKMAKEDREALEKFFGLIPGSIKHIRGANNPAKRKDPAYGKMLEKMFYALAKLMTLEYQVMYDRKVKELVDKVVRLFDRTGVEDLTELDCIRYYLWFLIFVVNGHEMLYQHDGEKINERVEKIQCFDQYALLVSNWQEMLQDLPEKSVKINFIRNLMDMFDWKDVIAMRRYIGLPIKRADDRSFDEEIPLDCFWDIRKMKERLFPAGPWYIALYVSVNKIPENELDEFADLFCELRPDWSLIEKYKTGTATIQTTDGEKELSVYEWGQYNFTDVYEIMSLYVCRNLLQN